MVKYVLSLRRSVSYSHAVASLLTLSLPRGHLLIPLMTVRLRINAHLSTILSPGATKSTVTTMRKTTLVKLVKGVDVSTSGYHMASIAGFTKTAEKTEVESGSRRV